MFGTILDKAASYFDRRALVSSFFPSLVFWGLSIIIFIVFQIGWQTPLNSWNKQSAAFQFILILAFFVWITFWSFLTSNFRTAYTRLFEGYWPEKGLFNVLLKWRQRSWQKRWSDLNTRRIELSNQVGQLKTGQDRYEESLKQSPALQSGIQVTSTEDAETFRQALEAFLNTLTKKPPSKTSSSQSSAKDIQDRLHEIQDWRLKLRPWMVKEKQEQKSAFAERDKQLREVQKQLSKQFDDQYAELEKKRVSLNHEVSLYYPPEPRYIMATKLGNVLRAIELYSSKRYHIDAVLLWPRLQPNLPADFATALQDSLTSLDLMVTLSAFTLLFGIPLAIWGAIKTTIFFPWWLSLALILITAFLRLYPLVGLSIVALLMSIFFNFKSAFPIMQFQVFIIELVALFLLFWLCYQNAVQAAFDYGEKIKSAFDLYRWKILDALHLQLPTTLEEERDLWDDVCGLLDRDYSPASRVFHYAKEDKQFLSLSPLPSTLPIPVPAKDLPAYHMMMPEDVAQEQVSKTLIPVDAVHQQDELVGKCTLKALPASQPVRSAFVVDPRRLKDTAAVGIRASLANVLGESLQAGDCIDVMLVLPKSSNEPSPQQVSFENLLVLDVIEDSGRSGAEYPASERSFVVVLAIPVTKKLEFLTLSTYGTILFSRTLNPMSVTTTSPSP